VKGAFTDAASDRMGAFEYADGGTLFMDEVGDMPMSTQIKLLRVLEEHRITRVGDNKAIKVNVRLLSATNRPLEEMVEEGKFHIKGYDGPTLECDKCGAEMQLKSGRFGKYFGCTSEECKNTRKLLRDGNPAPPKMDPVPMPELQCQKVDDTYILRDGAAGLFLAASKFPKNRETRPPLLAELLPHKDAIDPKYSFLFDGPVADPDGHPSVIRFSRKTKEQYLMSEVIDGEKAKATGWTAYYQGGKWVETAAKPKAKPKKAAAKKKK